MRDCMNIEMRELLPDLLHERLLPARLGEVRAHLAACDGCRAELNLLRRVRDAAPAPRVNVARIVDALPAYAAPRHKTAFGIPMLRIAAAIMLLTGGGLLFHARRAREASQLDSVQRLTEISAPVLALGETFLDVSDSDLQALADEMGALEAVMSEHPEEVIVPLTGQEGS